ncbi:Na+/melibiose symporter-like transporter [Novosphingobium sp. PhB165]|uniref:MFS transporter n=1 Tax=Novosphingobium sp. PhB165 TaxID=2485105 RepID=UPI001047CC7B|nr:MFS transporter [Novosphingobium sp. PhB165]TCM19388.1 Na+/melibiose symporter-like transporter [Novosphingobium sp. PhB165]
MLMRAGVTDPFPKDSLRAFAVSHLAKNLLWSAEDAFAFYVLVVVLRLDPVLAGGVFLAGSAWNALLDIGWGALLARRPGLGRWLPVIAALAAPIACVSFALLPLAGSGGIGPAIALILLFRTSFAFFDVPHNALNVPLAAHYGHMRLMRLRTIVTAGGALLVAAMALPLMLIGGPRLPTMLFAFLASVAFLGLLPLPWMFTHLWRGQGERPTSSTGLRDMARVALCVLPFCLAQMVGAGALGAIGKALLHLRIHTQWVLAAAPLAIAIARLGVIPAWNALARRHGLAQSLSIAYLLIGAVILLLPVAVDAGPFGAILVFAVFGGLVGGIALLAWSLFSELVGQAPAIRGPGDCSLAYGLFTATTKIGLGASACLAGKWLESQSDLIAMNGAALWPLAMGTAALCLTCSLLTIRPVWIFRLRPRVSVPGNVLSDF